MNKGLLFVVSGPAGSGKGTVLSELFKRSEDFVYSVSATTRQPRPGEVHGVNYYYISKDEFKKLIEQDGFIEHAEYVDNYYGTLRSEVEDRLNEGKNVVLEIEVQGAAQVKAKYPEAVFVLLLPPNYSTLSYRLHKRGTETEEVIQERLAQAKKELESFDLYDYVITNENGVIDPAVNTILAISDAERHKVSRTENFVSEFLNN